MLNQIIIKFLNIYLVTLIFENEIRTKEIKGNYLVYVIRGNRS